ncbi:MAG: hypothetical protein EGR48_12065 [Lachnospiraceae bacterium]|nr:hypothetical protein [Lachnospiraceae bacterium]
MRTESLEKIRNIIVTLFILFFSILIMMTAFCSLPVHAAESTASNKKIVQDHFYKYEGDSLYLKFIINDDCYNQHTEWEKTDFNSSSKYAILAYSNSQGNLFLAGLEYIGGDTVYGFNIPYGNTSYSPLLAFQYMNKEDSKYYWIYNNIVTNLPVLYMDVRDNDVLVDYFKNGNDEHVVLPGGGSIDNPDFEDTAYAFIGFTANNKMTATWTGTTERSYLQDQEVEEYVRVNYYFADKEAQDTIKQADAYPDEFATADKTLTIDVSGLKPDDENWFLRYIRITPCYRQSGLGAWGDFYHGSDVFVYFDVNGKIESIVQNSVPTDGEVIGNNISLIGFRYDTSFHAEFVDVWSNAVNCSAFDLGGSQYLSLGVKALYYNGQSKDIDFVSLDRKNLVWDKTFDSFKTFNGSGIKQLFFTPYIKTGVNNPWNKGNSIVIDFDVNGNATSSFDTGDDGTVHLSDFKLTGVVWNKPMLAYGTITWAGTTANSDMSIVPDSDTLVVCSYPVYDSSLNESYETYDTVTIGKGSIRVYIDSLIDKYTNAGKTWNGEMWLTPCYKKGGVLYMGEPVIVNCIKGTVSDIEVDESTGTANQVDKTDENKSYADAILSSGNNFFSIVKGLIASMQQLPELIATLFSFLPGWVNALIAGSIFIIFVCRILGR